LPDGLENNDFIEETLEVIRRLRNESLTQLWTWVAFK
jgi:hypothetical protein